MGCLLSLRTSLPILEMKSPRKMSRSFSLNFATLRMRMDSSLTCHLLTDCAARRVDSEEVPVEYRNKDLVLPGGPQVAVAVEKDEERKKKSRTEVADMVGSFRMCRGSNALTEEFDEWQFSTEAQRDIMATNLAALVFFHIGQKRYPNV